jgi:membrane-bound lytic murein transglycosylase A
MLRYFFILCLLFALPSCLFNKRITIKTSEALRLNEQDFQDLEGWNEDDHKLALQTFLHSCRKFSKMPQNSPLNGKLLDITAGDFRDVCDIGEVVKQMSAKQTKNFFENWFKLFLVESKSGEENGVFTGYYEASLRGSFVKNDKYKYPIYAKPKDVNFDANLTRKDIENGALASQKLELIYVDDKVDLFFMHIQGSGRVILPNGNEIRLAFAGKNQHPFNAISNEMFEKGLISKDEYNSKGVRKWLKNNPEKAEEIMNLNNSFTFFRIFDNEYVIGAQGVPLTSERSLAVDNEIMPFGTPLWVQTQLKNSDNKESFNKLMIAQDTGSAIKGVVRGDIFFGYGEEAENKAFTMASKGKYYVLLPINFVDKVLGR